jgi:DNA replication and repair protein RecF
MILTGIRLSTFRNHRDTMVDFGRGINAFLGENGQGKTNILEAMSYLGLTKSFYAASDADATQFGEPGFSIEGRLLSDAGTSHAVRIVYRREPPAKEYVADGNAPETMASVVGRFPVVVLSPENSAITFGAPADRRKFLDVILSQVGAPYLNDLMEYRHVLRQRNRLLGEARMQGKPPDGLIEPWTEALVSLGARVSHRRWTFVEEFRQTLASAYAQIVPEGEVPDVAYRPGFASETAAVKDLAAQFSRALEMQRGEETRRGTTLSGPHRDDILFTLNGTSVQHFASQGQHKSLLLGLKVAEFMYVRERRGETPLFLLDDVFSELDARRAARILTLVEELGQTMITATEATAFGHAVAWGTDHRRFTVEHGTCRQAA